MNKQILRQSPAISGRARKELLILCTGSGGYHVEWTQIFSGVTTAGLIELASGKEVLATFHSEHGWIDLGQLINSRVRTIKPLRPKDADDKQA